VLVFVSEATPASAKKLEADLQNVWPMIEEQGIKEWASIKNYEFLGRVDDLETRLKVCDFIQEVYESGMPPLDREKVKTMSIVRTLISPE
jgi:hypothetical protein